MTDRLPAAKNRLRGPAARLPLCAKGLRTGEDFFVVFSPEREDPGNEKFNTRTIPKIVGSSTPACLKQDCVILVTDHDASDYDAIAKHARLLVDTRGRCMKPLANVVKA